jgi:hypothetical protein
VEMVNAEWLYYWARFIWHDSNCCTA